MTKQGTRYSLISSFPWNNYLDSFEDILLLTKVANFLYGQEGRTCSMALFLFVSSVNVMPFVSNELERVTALLTYTLTCSWKLLTATFIEVYSRLSK
jgi:hypothetical protein